MLPLWFWVSMAPCADNVARPALPVETHEAIGGCHDGVDAGTPVNVTGAVAWWQSCMLDDLPRAQDDEPVTAEPWCFNWPYHVGLTLLFLVNGVFLLGLGVLEAVEASDAGRLMIAIVWFAAGANAVAAAAAVLRSKPWRLSPSLGAAISGVLVWLYVVWADQRSPSSEAWAPLAVVMLVLSLLSGLVIAHLIKLSPITTWKAVLATLLPVAGVVQFWYSNQYAPRLERPHLNLSVSMEQIGPPGRPDAGRTPLQATISVENKSGAQVQVLGSVYSVSTLAHDGGAAESGGTSTAGVRRRPGQTELVRSDEIMGPSFFFEPGERWSKTIAVLLPHGTTPDVAFASAELVVASGARLKLKDHVGGCVMEEEVAAELDYRCMVRKIAPQGAIDLLVDDRPTVTTLTVFAGKGTGEEDPPVPSVAVFLDERDPKVGNEKIRMAGTRKLQNKYNVLSTDSSYELPLRSSVECRLPATWDQAATGFASGMGPPPLPVMGPP